MLVYVLMLVAALAGPMGSVHDTRTVESCELCHVSQGAAASTEVFTRYSGFGTAARSSVCLGCHDGIFAPGVHLLGVGEHPVSVPVTTSATLWTPEGIQALGLPLYGPEARMECPSCHVPHARLGVRDNLLRQSNDGSALCLICHRV